MSRLPQLTLGFATVLLLTSASAEASSAAPAAEAMKQPVAYVERPLTLPAMTLSPELNVQISGSDLGSLGTAVGAGVEVGASFGVLDDLTVEARPLGFVTGSGGTEYSRFQIGATYRFLDGPVEIGGQFRFQVTTDGTLAFNPGLPVRIHAGNIVRIDTGLNFTGLVPTRSGADPVALLGGIRTDAFRAAEAGIPLDVAFQIAEPVFLGLSTGVGIFLLSNAGDSLFMPLGFFAGGTVPGPEGPLVDLGASFGFPLFLTGGSDSNPNTEIWTLQLTARGFFYF